VFSFLHSYDLPTLLGALWSKSINPAEIHVHRHATHTHTHVTFDTRNFSVNRAQSAKASRRVLFAGSLSSSMVRCKPTTGKLTADSIKENDCIFFVHDVSATSWKRNTLGASSLHRSFSRTTARERETRDVGKGKDQGIEIGRFTARHVSCSISSTPADIRERRFASEGLKADPSHGDPSLCEALAIHHDEHAWKSFHVSLSLSLSLVPPERLCSTPQGISQVIRERTQYTKNTAERMNRT